MPVRAARSGVRLPLVVTADPDLLDDLPTATWVRFVVWLVIGMIIYFAYGRSHSLVGRRSAADSREVRSTGSSGSSSSSGSSGSTGRRGPGTGTGTVRPKGR